MIAPPLMQNEYARLVPAYGGYRNRKIGVTKRDGKGSDAADHAA
jgi:hypothetical protein